VLYGRPTEGVAAMHGDTDLKTLEKRAFKKFNEDGLFDIFLGVLLFLMPAAGQMDGLFPENEAVALGALLLFYAALVLAFTLGRKRLVAPRLGSFTPSKPRRKRIHAVRAALSGSVLLGVAMWVFASSLSGGQADGRIDFLNLLPLIWLLNATIVFGAMAFFLDVPRFYLYGPLFGVAVMLDIYSRTMFEYELSVFVAFGAPAAIIVAIGTYKLVRFLKDYPVRGNEVALDGRQ
jgi:hypothetical protein